MEDRSAITNKITTIFFMNNAETHDAADLCIYINQIKYTFYVHIELVKKSTAFPIISGV